MAQVTHDPFHNLRSPGEPDVALLAGITIKRCGTGREDLQGRTGKD